MYDYSCNIMNSSIRIGESGARPHRVGDTSPLNWKILMFKPTAIQLCNKLHTKFNNEHFCVYLYSVAKDLWYLL